MAHGHGHGMASVRGTKLFIRALSTVLQQISRASHEAMRRRLLCAPLLCPRRQQITWRKTSPINVTVRTPCVSRHDAT
eukprot:4675993-Prymnesium_polylepis.1